MTGPSIAARERVGLAEVLLALDRVLAWKEEQADRRRTAHPFTYGPGEGREHASAEDVGMALGLWEMHEVEPEWCDGCHKLLQEARFYRSVPWGRVTTLGRQLGKLAKAGFVERNERYPSLYTLTLDGEALLADAEAASVAVLREAVE